MATKNTIEGPKRSLVNKLCEIMDAVGYVQKIMQTDSVLPQICH